MAALDNEKRILSKLNQTYSIDIKKATSVKIKDDLEVSVDFIWKDKDLTFLFEIVSYSAAKIIFGEYVLLNQVKAYKSNCILVIIHCYKKYNIERTEKYFKFAVDKLKCKLPYVVFSNSEWQELVKNKSKTELINIINKSLKS
jgi:hypothetical protein